MIDPCVNFATKLRIPFIIYPAAVAVCLYYLLFPSSSYALSDIKLLLFDFNVVNADASYGGPFNSKLKSLLEEKGFKVIAAAGIRDRKIDRIILREAPNSDDYATLLAKEVQAKRFIKGEFGTDTRGFSYIKGSIFNAEQSSKELSFLMPPRTAGRDLKKNIQSFAESCAEKIYNSLAYSLPEGKTSVLLISLSTCSMEEGEASDATALLEKKLKAFGLFKVNRDKTADSEFHNKYGKESEGKFSDIPMVYRSVEESLMRTIARNGGASKILFGSINFTGKRYSIRLELHDSAKNKKMYYFDKRASLKGDLADLIDCAAKDFIKNYIFTDKCLNIKLDINSAKLDTIELLPGLNRERAENIIIYRQANGSFSCIEDLECVPGINFKILKKFSSYVKCITEKE